MTPAEFRTIRDRAGLTQLQLARLLGRTREHVNAIECGRAELTNLMAAFMRLLNVEPDLARKILEE